MAHNDLNATTIRSIRASVLDVPLHAPFGIAGGAQAVANNVLVAVELASGAVGHGEAAPLPAFNGETQEAAMSAIEEARSAIVGADARAWRVVAAATAEATGGTGSARCAIETAVMDALGRHFGFPLWSWFGGAERVLRTDITIPLGSIDDSGRQARAAAAAGFTALKIKVGSGDDDLDAQRSIAASRAAPGASILLDANAGLSTGRALTMVRELLRLGVPVTFFEQPTPAGDFDAFEAFAAASPVPTIADELVTSPSDVARIGRGSGLRGVNVKLMKSGVADALGIALAARAHGLVLMIGGMIETRLAMGMSACLAAGLGGFEVVDLDTPMFLQTDPFEGGYDARGPVLDLAPIEAGHGARPRAQGLQTP